MKKIILLSALLALSFGYAQYYPSGGYSQGNDIWQGNDDYYFPDDYYYDYPNDYYHNDYYRSQYNDYKRSINRVNWTALVRDMRLSGWQAEMLFELNNQFPTFGIWYNYYSSNPSRWYYDRFYALERILGPRAFAIYQNRFYNGYSPVRYYVNYWRDYYRPRYYSHYILPRYRQVNVNVYRVDRNAYHRSVGNRYGYNQPRNTNSASFGKTSQSSSVRTGASNVKESRVVNQRSFGSATSRQENSEASRTIQSRQTSKSPGLRGGTVNASTERVSSQPRRSAVQSNSTPRTSASGTTQGMRNSSRSSVSNDRAVQSRPQSSASASGTQAAKGMRGGR